MWARVSFDGASWCMSAASDGLERLRAVEVIPMVFASDFSPLSTEVLVRALAGALDDAPEDGVAEVCPASCEARLTCEVVDWVIRGIVVSSTQGLRDGEAAFH